MSQFTTHLLVNWLVKIFGKLERILNIMLDHIPVKKLLKFLLDLELTLLVFQEFFGQLFPPVDEHAKAAVVHDYCYAEGLYSRKRCDEIFLEAMAVLDVNYIKRYTMYGFVRVFSFYSWYRCRRGFRR